MLNSLLIIFYRFWDMAQSSKPKIGFKFTKMRWSHTKKEGVFIVKKSISILLGIY